MLRCKGSLAVRVAGGSAQKQKASEFAVFLAWIPTGNGKCHACGMRSRGGMRSCACGMGSQV